LKTIVFVCTGNTCRSSMAEALFKEMIKDRKDIKVKSAGIWALNNSSASYNAIKVMEERNIDLTGHRATALTREILEEADLILTMTKNHKEEILKVMPEIRDKVYTLKEYAGYGEVDILDPYGGDIEVYRKAADDIEDALRKILDKI